VEVSDEERQAQQKAIDKEKGMQEYFEAITEEGLFDIFYLINVTLYYMNVAACG